MRLGEAQLASNQAQVVFAEQNYQRVQSWKAKGGSETKGVSQQEIDQDKATLRSGGRSGRRRQGEPEHLPAEPPVYPRDFSDRWAGQPLFPDAGQPDQPGSDAADHRRVSRPGLRLLRRGPAEPGADSHGDQRRQNTARAPPRTAGRSLPMRNSWQRWARPDRPARLQFYPPQSQAWGWRSCRCRLEPPRISVLLGMPGDNRYPYQGFINFSNNQLNPQHRQYCRTRGLREHQAAQRRSLDVAGHVRPDPRADRARRTRPCSSSIGPFNRIRGRASCTLSMRRTRPNTARSSRGRFRKTVFV